MGENTKCVGCVPGMDPKMPTLPTKIVIVIDRDKYHTVRTEDTQMLSASDKKKVLVDWMERKSIHISKPSCEAENVTAEVFSYTSERCTKRHIWEVVQRNKVNPMYGHLLYVVCRTSTPSWGKPGATRCCWDPPWQYRVATGASTVYHCRGPLACGPQSLSLAASERAHAVREFNLSSLLLRAGDVHPNPGPTLRIAQFNILGFTPGKRLSLLH
ncbi:hypothetical protein XU18_2545 [Perkinsela sp. CCAP 1560/4]|nr:hypothetical protein XU18_2545 [Perkinsela sp. CCAP 1560/4]|eukprot:KNH06644.1 hypothetical protein XU18_2545 [Perkinsela sp. CCAP 1560/4]